MEEQTRGNGSLMPRYTLPEVSESELKYRPRTVHVRFSEDLYQMVEMWREKYRGYFDRYSASSIMEGMIQRLEKEAHLARKKKKR